jgi:hypothetical protein
MQKEPQDKTTMRLVSLVHIEIGYSKPQDRGTPLLGLTLYHRDEYENVALKIDDAKRLLMSSLFLLGATGSRRAKNILAEHFDYEIGPGGVAPPFVELEDSE